MHKADGVNFEKPSDTLAKLFDAIPKDIASNKKITAIHMSDINLNKLSSIWMSNDYYHIFPQLIF